MTAQRCQRCNKMLFKGHFIEIQIKCGRCGYMNELSATECHSRELNNVRSGDGGGESGWCSGTTARL
ncbi:Com family DNA-binding transcriptional regulator [Salmonella enterica]|nr:Com family DNA-binding transcriptional regulator [Salmonella enterica]EBG8070668.1 Com family DNA-binding transcriptional regulator [Salmonella enterica subsp. enterica serovar Elisabethville]EBR0085622.1 Com family DNA-binding transcriptional regulator [Salmonella enterica subsp. enterica serovar Wangata]EDT2941822.1 Com family DNA-binding transcriptional regulator [Salmonella enterica subsp. enterica]EAB1774568.1 Com family DNA-binding transcriptional regulator [Salmonella enterica]